MVGRHSTYSKPPVTDSGELPPGSLELLILKIVSIEPMHGYAIAQEIERRSRDFFRVEQGSLYPALERILRDGTATASWGKSPTGRRARYYTITASGRRQLSERIARFERVNVAIRLVLKEA